MTLLQLSFSKVKWKRDIPLGKTQTLLGIKSNIFGRETKKISRSYQQDITCTKTLDNDSIFWSGPLMWMPALLFAVMLRL